MNGGPARPLAVLIAAMGGEGGGVFANWLVAAARSSGLVVQATSIPGVAQRTGATTYYLELWPEPLAPGASEPVFALYPTPGEVDVVVASELIEAGRAIENGFVTPDRTLLIASTHRIYAIAERAAMADGRVDSERFLDAADTLSRRALMADFAAAAKVAGAPVNAVLLGAVAAANALPIDRAAFQAAIETEGKAVGSNLAGFAAGERLAAGDRPTATSRTAWQRPVPERLRAETRAFGPPLSALVGEAVARLTDYQDERYALRFLARLAPVAELSPDVALECARQMALRMSYEDVIRVAQLKTRGSRLRALREEVGAGGGQPVRIREYLKPGLEEWCALLPPAVGRRLIGWATARGIADRFGVAMRIRSDTVFGFALLRGLAALRRLRPLGYRWQVEQRWIDDWVARVIEATRRDEAFGIEVAALAGLVKGYGDTWQRGLASYRRIAGALVTPWLAGNSLPDDAAARLREAREAASADPDGNALDAALDASPAAAVG